jgi:hypothetical protein
MKTITIGCYGRNANHDIATQYHQITTRIDPGSTTSRPQFCIELKGGEFSIAIYAASEAALTRLKGLIGAGKTKCRIIPGLDVLGIHIQWPPRGWPNEAQGRTTVRRAPTNVIATAAGSLPDAPATEYVFRTTPGVEVIHLSPNQVIKFMPYHPEDAITVRSKIVTLTSGNQDQEFIVIHILSADTTLAQSLAGSFMRKTPRRIVVNKQVTGIGLIFANGTHTALGNALLLNTATK